uniref:Protein kinase domain-containing protein n=1 Tax=Sarcophilus harrisii TaxID=9305 RepID=A0A7N4V264_SARHA
MDEFLDLNRINEGTYGVVYRAKEKKTHEIVALKKLKMKNKKEGFPMNFVREINLMQKVQHPNIVAIREIIVMNYVEQDLRKFMNTMKQPFLPEEVKTLMIQLIRGVKYLHDNWILHRDLKPSNLLLSNSGILKIGDLGLARVYGDLRKAYTPLVVSLWYRAPELLLGAKEYSTEIDMWSVGCIFGELLSKVPLFQGKSEIGQINKIFKKLGTPTEEIWPGYNDLPAAYKGPSVANQVRFVFAVKLKSRKVFSSFLETPCPVSSPAGTERDPLARLLGSPNKSDFIVPG